MGQRANITLPDLGAAPVVLSVWFAGVGTPAQKTSNP